MQIIIFELHNERFGFDLTRIKEINRQLIITLVPTAPAHFMGVANLRGKIVPVISLRSRLGFPEPKEHSPTRTIVLELGGELVGFMVDRVIEVIRINQENILEFSGRSSIPNKECVSGIVKQESGIITLLDLERLI